jgi:hypothetical protein
MNRIDKYCNLHFAFLRECSHPSIQINHEGVTVVAEEFSGETGEVVRTWFVLLGAHEDGRPLPNITPPHILVSPDIKPGEPSQPPVPGYQPPTSIGQDQLRRMRVERNELLATRERHTIHCAEWHKHLAKIAEQSERIEQLESQHLATVAEHQSRVQQIEAVAVAATREQSDTINGLQSEVAARLSTIGELQSSLRSARKQKSLPHRLRMRVKWLTRKD